MDLNLSPSRRRCPALSDLVPSLKKSSNNIRKDLICTVCGSAATGFNFGVITCMCCKAFFRRKALLGLSALQCRYLNEKCSINYKTRRDCSYCRLNKCFQVGMKKELILSDELKQIKREKILANRQQTLNSIHPIDSLHMKKYSRLNDSDLSFLTNIYNAYEDYTRLPMISYEKTEYNQLVHQPIKARIKFSHYNEHLEKSRIFLVNFFERLPEFKQLSNSEQQTLVQQNSRFLIRISFIETLNEVTSIWPAIDLLIRTIFGNDIINQFDSIIHIFKEQINDSLCIRLFLIISLFSMNQLSTNSIDTSKVYRIQEKYIELLWCYLKQRYTERAAYQYFSIMLRHTLHMQIIGHLADVRRTEIFTQNSFFPLND